MLFNIDTSRPECLVLPTDEVSYRASAHRIEPWLSRNECISDVAARMRSNRLQLNAAKTEVLWCASRRRQGQLPDAPFTVGSDAVKPVRCVRDLCIYQNSDVSMRTHVSKTVASYFASLRQIRSTHTYMHNLY